MDLTLHGPGVPRGHYGIGDGSWNQPRCKYVGFGSVHGPNCMHEYLGVSKDVHGEPRTGSPANAKLPTGEAHDGWLGYDTRTR